MKFGRAPAIKWIDFMPVPRMWQRYSASLTVDQVEFLIKFDIVSMCQEAANNGG